MKKILIVEDDSFLQGLEASKLTKEGYEIATASNGIEALKNIENLTDFSFVLLDLMLPDIDGFMILEKIRAHKDGATIPVIVFSNMSEEKDMARAKKLGVTEFMIKSNFTLDELVEKVKTLHV